MDRRDYILRMIEQMGAVFARLREIIMGGHAEVEDELKLAAHRSGVDLAMARALDPESLLGLLSAEGQPDPTRTWLFAELLAIDGLAAETRGRLDQALALFQKALRLYLAIDPRIIGGIPEAASRVDELQFRISRLTDIPPSAA